MLESRRLHCFLVVAEELHFGRAAERLDIAQSALSKQVKELEKSLGLRLLNRGRRSAISLTESGRTLFADASIGVEQLGRAERSARRAARGEIGSVSIGYVTSAALCGLLPQTLDRFRRILPEVQLELHAMETPRQLAALSEGLIDVGFLRPRREYAAGITACIVHSEPMLIAIAANHPLAKKRVDLHSLAEQTFIIPQFDENTGFAEHLANLASSGGFEPKKVTHVRDFVTAITLASGGYGVVPVPRCMLSINMRNIAYKMIHGYVGAAELAVARSARRATMIAERLVGCAEDARAAL
jgi:DNA-binding transcriptional LysR family regulator